MDGKSSLGLLVNLSNCKEPAHEAAFNHWYNHIHIPEVLATKVYHTATRFKNAAPKPGEPMYLALYETTWEDPVAASTEMRKRAGAMNISPDLEGKYRRNFKRISDFPAKGPARRATGVLFVVTNCTDPAREGEFNRWYDSVHIPERIETGSVYSAARYAIADPQPGDAKFLALYETDAKDPVAAINEMPKRIKQPTTRFDGFTVQMVMTFVRI
jgi:hypothetical protein